MAGLRNKKMKIKMVTRLASPKYQAAPGQVINVDEITGKSLSDGGFAQKIEDAMPEIETAMKSEPENKMINRGAKRK